MSNKSQKARDKAREYFGLTPNDYNLVLHHVDPTLKKRDPERYKQWRIEDLCIMSRAEHTSLHQKGKKAPPLSEEHKKRISEANKDKKLSEETRAKISAARKGQKLPPRSEEYKNKMSEVKKIPVCQYTLDGEFVKEWSSMIDAGKEGGFDGSTIAKVCKGKLKQHKNYIWKYVNDKT